MNKATRRQLLKDIAKISGFALISGFSWSAFISKTKASPLTLRPPGAIFEDDFLKQCIKCGLCVEACPFDTLKLAKFNDDKPIGTPFFIPRNKPCYMCIDIPCVPVCPTNALDVNLVSKNEKLDIKKAKMGVAVIDENACIAFWGIQCDACYRACPLLGDAIKIEYEKNTRTGKHAFLKPVVFEENCTGCGLCEKACITQKASIFVLPRNIALGVAGEHYIKGWDKEDEKRIKQTNTKTFNKNLAIDSLNSGLEDLLE